MRKEEKNLVNTNNEFFLIFLENNKFLILLKLKNLIITGFFLIKIDFN